MHKKSKGFVGGGPSWWWCGWMLVCTLLSTMAYGQVSSIGSFVELNGQVIAPSTTTTLGSTNDLVGGDQVRWTSYFQSRISNPYEVDGQIDLPAHHTYVAGSVQAPTGTVLQWLVGGAWQTTEPATGTAVTSVKWSLSSKVTVSTSTVNSSANFSGTGDGYRVIPYGDYLFVINHHTAGAVLKCRNAADGLGCPVWGSGGYGFEIVNNVAITSSSGSAYYSPNNPVEAMNYKTGELFVGMSSSSEIRIFCTDLNRLKSCGSWSVGSSGGYWTVDDIGVIGNKYYIINSASELVCFDFIKKKECGRTYYPGAVSGFTTSFLKDGKVFFSPDSSRFYCHDALNNSPCSGWPTSGVVASGAGAYPYLNPNGTVKGVCGYGVRTYSSCVALDGSLFSPSNAYVNMLLSYYVVRSKGHNVDAFKGSRAYFADGSRAACFDFSTDSMCGVWDSGMALSTYSTRFDPNRPNCLMLLGDSAQAFIFDVTTGSSCKGGVPASLPDLTFSPVDYFKCDNSRAKVKKWGALRLSPSLPWGGTNGLDSVTVTLKDSNDALLPTANTPVRNLVYGTYQLDISDIPYAQFPSLKVTIEFHTPGTLPQTVVFGVDMTWDGDPMQVCVETKAPNPADCQSTAKSTVNTRAVDYTAGVYQETLSAGKMLSTGGLSTGYGALSAATTVKANVTALSATDPRTMVLQGRWALQKFTGDLWAFGLTATEDIDNSNYWSAQTGTLSASSRPMYTANAVVGQVNPVKVLDWSTLTAGQQAALNTDLNGLLDSLGSARLAYLRGTDGAFRSRGGTSLGPVINSAPVVLPVAPLAGWPEVGYPGYNAYRMKVQRNYPIALYGGNDGALHGYEVTPSGFKEAYAFVPEVMLKKAASYTDTSIVELRANPYFVDNVPLVGHAKVGNLGWKAVGVMLYGRGARAITALDLTQTNLGAGVGTFFDYDNTAHADLKDLGYIISQPNSQTLMHAPQIVQIGSTRRSGVLVGNGINSNDGVGGAAASGPGRPVLYAFYFDPTVGPKWHRWAVDELWSGIGAEPGVGSNNGLSTPRPVDVDGDGIIDVVYAGDMQGNLWRFDVHNPDSVKVTRLFKTDVNQPITQAPYAQVNPQVQGCVDPVKGGSGPCWQVVVHTGAEISPLQGSNNVSTQSIYGILDKGAGAEVAQSSLTKLPVLVNQVINGIEYRALSTVKVDYTQVLGWRADLQAYEHGVGAPKMLPTGVLALSSIRPTVPGAATNICLGPRSWLNEIDPVSGVPQALGFDVNADGLFDSNDLLTAPDGKTKLVPSGMAVSGAQFGPPALLQAGSSKAQTNSLLFSSLGQDTSQANSWSAGGSSSLISPMSSGPTVPKTKAMKHADKRKLGRMTWRQVL